jgi:ribosomal protein S18 acetylase RimI-like enzyme
MGVRLRPIRDDEFAAFIVASRDGYAADIEVNGGLGADAARKKADDDYARLFPGDEPSPEQTVLVVEDETSGEAVGRIWFAERDGDGEGRIAFVYELWVDEARRGSGFGRAAMEALEDLVQARGLGRIALNVLGGNETARSLYRSLGYRETAVYMAKKLGTS